MNYSKRIAKAEKKKNKNKKLYVLVVKNKKGEVLDLLASYNYSALMIEGMELSKEKEGTWTIFSALERKEIDGGFTKLKEMNNGS